MTEFTTMKKQNPMQNLCARLLAITATALIFVSAACAQCESAVLADPSVGSGPPDLNVATNGSAADLSSKAKPVMIDASQGGRVFDGIGAISGGGGNSRLLIDYNEPYRSQILDYLFKPGYGANLQIFKVEIGADMDSTDGAESSHMHTRTDENYNRGYEWWLMEQAKLRNPNIKLAALPWGAPGWVGGGTNYWSQDMIDYIVKWLKHAESDHHLKIDYIGGRNENGWDIQWYKDLKAALKANGLASIEVVASDEWRPRLVWAVATDMKKDPALYNAIDIIGAHGPSWSNYPAADALSIGKPLWDSEAHFDSRRPGDQVARINSRNYIKGKVVSTIYWPIISAIYDNMPFNNVGFIQAHQPWSGHYVIPSSLWAMAHTAQFAQPGWQYIDNACGFFDADATGRHGSFVTLQSANHSDYSVIIETVDASAPQTAEFSVTGFSPKPLHVWMTNLRSQNSDDWFIKQQDVALASGKFSLTLQPGRMYSLTTTSGQGKGDAVSPPASPLELPYAENFDSYPVGKLGKYFADLYGAFETAPCDGGRTGICLRQVCLAEPISWKTTENRPFTMMGNLDWTNYRVSCDVLLAQAGSVDLIGRLNGMSGKDIPNSYLVRVSDAGAWSIMRTSVRSGPWGAPGAAATRNYDATLASGNVAALGINTWHNLALVCNGNSISAQIDGVTVGTISDSSYAHGMVGFGVVGFHSAEFDNFKVDPIK
jgi:O-glycosyl hydrolase